MSKPVIGLLVGAVLGIFDGLTAWFTPEVRGEMLAIVIGSTFKGIIAGVIMGFIARKYQSLPIGIIVGLLVGAVLAFFVAHMQGKYYFEIMLPGSIVGMLVGFATQKYGQAPAIAQ